METQIDKKYHLTDKDIANFRKQGWVSASGVLDSSSTELYRREISKVVKNESEEMKPMKERDSYNKAFLQVHNLWEKNHMIKEFTLGRRFAGIAAKLLGVERVRLYHDQALYKESGGGKTPWHQDQYYWPIDTFNTITIWMPLVDIDEEMGILQFASGSHKKDGLKAIAISDDSDAYFEQVVEEQNYELSSISNYRAGDASFHYGWTIHYAPGNQSKKLREVMTVIYVADGARVKEPEHEAQVRDLEQWLPGLKPGDLVNSDLNPLI